MRARTLVALLIAGTLAGAAVAAEAGAKLKVLVVWGGHGFNHDAFFKMFQDNPAITCTEAKHDKTSEVYGREDLLSYDVVVLYDFWQKITDEQKAKFLSLFEKGVGLIVLHHALATYQDWPEFEKAVGGKFLLKDEEANGVKTPKSGTGGGPIALHVVSKDHAITKGMEDFTLQDEYYNKCRVSQDVTLLLTTDNPKNQKEVAWCREQGKSRVLYIMSGHDQKVYNDPNFRKILANAIQWAARK
ncbi:MAG TPA: ThuA domain-containing protein [Planctomycetota bacterium]|nr:ThuA domain-containing protein [Planctomycetota bacterium]